jgi:hypothetical protein
MTLYRFWIMGAPRTGDVIEGSDGGAAGRPVVARLSNGGPLILR